jgi:hypothetical protein
MMDNTCQNCKHLSLGESATGYVCEAMDDNPIDDRHHEGCITYFTPSNYNEYERRLFQTAMENRLNGNISNFCEFVRAQTDNTTMMRFLRYLQSSEIKI